MLELYNKFTKKEKKYVKHIFEFATEEDWRPLEPTCWGNCPFSFMIKLGEHCKCLDGEIKCPFVDKIDC